MFSYDAGNWVRIKDDAYVSSSSPGGGTSQCLVEIVRVGGTGVEVCCLRLRLVLL